MSGKRWSMARRMKLWFAGTTVSFVVVISAVSAWFIYGATDRELDALVVEEIDELRAITGSGLPTRDALEEVTRELAAHHPGVTLAWRFWRPGTDGSWADFGPTELVDELPDAPGPLRETTHPSAGHRWRAEDFDWTSDASDDAAPDLVIGLLIDGTRRFAYIRRFGFLALAVIGVATILALIGGTVFCQQMSTMMSRVAEQVRAIEHPGDDTRVVVDDAPDEIREVADALEEMLRNIREASERARLMTAGMAHELRSPLQNLLGQAEVALMRERDADHYRGVIESQVEELHDLRRVVDNLVTLCAAAETASRRELERFDLGVEAEFRLGKEHADASRANVELEVVTEGDLVLHGDREAVLLMLRNLVSNAIQWAPEGTTVRVRVAGDDEHVVDLTVDDQGPGVPAEDREHIFEPFRRGTQRNGSRVGFGLGLALSRSAVRTQGGSIDVETAPSGGARFHVVLPRRATADDGHRP